MATRHPTSMMVCISFLVCVFASGMFGCNRTPTTLALENPAAPNQVSQGFDSRESNLPATISVLNDLDPDSSLSADVMPEMADAQEGRETATSESIAPPNLDETGTEFTRSQLVGQWQDSFFGRRTLVLNEDGTARMILDLDFAGQLLYGRRLEFEMRWSLEGATVTIDLQTGQPEKPAKSAMDTWGTQYEYVLECVQVHQIEMRDPKAALSYTLRRIPEDSAATAN